MQAVFETLISSYIENNIGIAGNFINKNLALHLRINLLALHKRSLFIDAGIGSADNGSIDQSIRSDSIYWLDRNHDDIYENEFFDLMDDFILHLNRTCYTGITGYEFHYSMYEKGSFYKKHIDKFQNNQSRKFSMINYLNTNWKEEDGGQLIIHQSNSDESISPTNGKTVFFNSNEMPHQVMVTNTQRMSITGWLKS